MKRYDGKKTEKLNLYRVLYLNESSYVVDEGVEDIEPIQSVVFK